MVTRYRIAGWLLLLSAALTCSAEDPAETLLLTRFRLKVRQDLAQLPNYTCLDTIKRWVRPAASRPFAAVDTVRLEVSSVGGKELYAWPGARRFEDKKLSGFVTSGATAEGMFALLARQLFIVGKGAPHYSGEESLEGRRAVRYDYYIPQFDSALLLRAHNTSLPVASKGSLWFDPVSLDLIRLNTFGDDIPAELDLAEARVNIEYARVRIGNSDALFPRQGEMMLIDLSGVASHNVEEFSQCHAYQTESTITFDSPAETPSAAPKPGVREASLPAGLLVPVVIETAIDSKSVAIGDPVRARVRQDVRQDGELVLPAGAAISGRIRRFQRPAAGAPYFVVGVELFEVEWANSRADFYGELVDSDNRKGITAGYGTRGSVTYTLPGKAFRIDPGLGLLWRILNRPAAPEQPR